jgi:hypothetical protein
VRPNIDFKLFDGLHRHLALVIRVLNVMKEARGRFMSHYMQGLTDPILWYVWDRFRPQQRIKCKLLFSLESF